MTKLAHENCEEDEEDNNSSYGVFDLLRDFAAHQGQITSVSNSFLEVGCTFCNKELKCETGQSKVDEKEQNDTYEDKEVVEKEKALLGGKQTSNLEITENLESSTVEFVPKTNESLFVTTVC